MEVIAWIQMTLWAVFAALFFPFNCAFTHEWAIGSKWQGDHSKLYSL